MAWLAVDENGLEYIYKYEPRRNKRLGMFCTSTCGHVPLPQGSIAKLLGRALTWSDDPVELK